jgi:hypothetical protein
VPKGKAMLRVSVSAAHADDDIYRLVNAFKVARDKVSGKGTGKVTRREAKRPPEAAVEVTDDSTMSGLNFDEVKALVAEAMAEGKVEKVTDRLPTDPEPEPKPASEDDPTSKAPAESSQPELVSELPPVSEESSVSSPDEVTRKTKTIKRATRIHKKV